MKKIKSLQKNISSGSMSIIFTFIFLAILLMVNALFQMNRSKKELLTLMTENARSLLESLLIASNDVIKSNEYIEKISQKRLLNNAFYIKELYEKNQISNEKLVAISQRNDINRINIFNKKGELLYSNKSKSMIGTRDHQPAIKLAPIFSGEKDTIIIGFKQACLDQGLRYPIAISTRDSGAIVVNIDAQAIQKLYQETGFGALIKNIVSKNKYIIYAALQDTSVILAGSQNVDTLDKINASPFLKNAFTDSLFATRETNFIGQNIFEAVQPFSYENQTIGLYRLGISLKPIRDINQQMVQRIVIISTILFFAGIIISIMLLTQYRLSILKIKFEVVETYAGSIINNVSDAIIVVDQEKGIKVFNGAAEKLFSREQRLSIGLPFKNIFKEEEWRNIISSDSKLFQIECTLNKKKHTLIVSNNTFRDRNEVENSVYVIRDMTNQKILEQSLERSKRLTAMGELASGVAHEIRNPLNTIGTIIQQLDKDFQPTEDAEEYHEFTQLVYKEVHRINETVQSFLQFAKPTPIYPKYFPLEAFLKQIQNQYLALVNEKNITIEIDLKWSKRVKWDENQMKQVFINIIQNAIDALGQDGIIAISVLQSEDESVAIHIKDNGPGMDEKTKEKIFNLYYTTKPTGTGIGLSIVQKIIQEHKGTVEVESYPGKGTEFIFHLPIIV